MRDEKLHAVVARSTFASEKVKHVTFVALLYVEPSKKCTPLWREAHFQVKMYQTHHSRTLLEVEMWKKCTPLWREAHFQVKTHKTPEPRGTFGSCDVKKVHAAVARSTFPSQNVQNTPFSDHFWKLRCQESARRCGAKHISKSTCTKHTVVGPLLEVETSKKCTPLWREAQLSKSKVQNTEGYGALLDVQMFCVARAGDCAPCQKWAKFEGSCSSFDYKQHYIRLHPTTTTTTALHYTTLNYTTPHYTTLQHTNYNYTTLHYATLITLHYATLHFTSLPYTQLHYTTTTTTTATTLQHTTLH